MIIIIWTRIDFNLKFFSSPQMICEKMKTLLEASCDPDLVFFSGFILGVCIYKGIEYTQGQTFEDGCDYNCVCFDASEGKYRCTPK